MYTARELNGWKLRDLLKLENEVTEAIKEAKVRDAKEVRAEIAEVAKRKGFSLEDIFGKKLFNKGGGKGYKTTMVAKYRNPEDPMQTWTGKGRKPNWMVAKLDKGASLDQFRA